MALSKGKHLVGLDIGSSSVKVVELKTTPKGLHQYHLVNLGMERLVPEAIVDGAIMDSGAVINAIHRVFDQNRVRVKSVATSLSGSSVIIRKISLPVMSDEELAESIHWEAEQYIPFAIEDVNLDYQVMERGSGDQATMDVILAAVKKDRINNYTSVITHAGRIPVVMDIDAFALQNAFEINYPDELDKVLALINVGASVTNITIFQQGTSVLWRDISFGGNQYTESIQKELNLSYEQAEELKKGGEVEGIPQESLLSILNSVSANIVREVQKTVDFFQAVSLDKLVISGGSAKIKGLDQFLSEKLNTPVEMFNPFRNISYSSREFDPDYLNEVAPIFGVAVGLALREVVP
ncbi:MAG: pilus assembly protein PilM [Candidatus Aminicenantes bacterium]|nr:pilus assembly protein PilM [Candidatus Aminicenantes bacterium]MDH5715063.1 pilus assembly protein PilM [Candidatus Aminicenantes bacterium]